MPSGVHSNSMTNGNDSAKRQQQTSHASAIATSMVSQRRGFHLTRLTYMQLITAFATLMFAMPISTKTSLSRMAVGPLVSMSQDPSMDVRDLN